MYEFRILGPLEVVRDGGGVALGGARQRSLLATLLVHRNEVVSSDRLVDELWGESPPATASTSLHGLVSQLRKALEPGRAPGASGAVLATRAPGYVLRVEPGALDAGRFEDLLAQGRGALDGGDAARAAAILREALALWRGRALDGADSAPSAHAEGMRLEELRLEGLETRIDADLALGRDEELVSELEALVEREPLREHLQAQLMLALYRSGRQADALDRYQRARQMFRDRLGIEPSPRLRELEQAMLRQDPELEAGLPRVRPRRALRRRRRLVGVVAAAAVLLGAAVATASVLTGSDGSIEGGPGSVAVVDSESGRVVDTIEVGSGPVAIVFGHGSVWVANSEDDTVSRIDPETREVEQTIGVPSPVDLAIGPDAVWVASGIAGSVSRIDPEANDVVATIDLQTTDPFDPRTVHGVATGAGGVWAAVSGPGLVRIDPERNKRARTLPVGTDQQAVATGHGALWVLSAGQLLRMEPTTGAVTSRLSVGGPGGFPNDVLTSDDSVLVLVGSVDAGSVWVVDPETTQLRRTLSVDDYVLAVADEPGAGVWTARWDGTVARLGAEADEGPPLHTKVAGLPKAMAIAPGGVWVAIGEREP